MASKRISELTARVDFDSTCNLPVETIPIADPDLTQRVTGEQVSEYTNRKPFTGVLRNVGLAVSVDTGALTIALKQADGESDPSDVSVHSVVEAIFRPELASSGARERLVFDGALSITIPAGATLGYANGENAKVFVYLYRSGANRGLAVSAGQKSPEVPITLVEISDGADDGDTAYSDNFDGDAGLVCIGYVEVLAIATAGTWTAPDVVYAGEILLSTGGATAEQIEALEDAISGKVAITQAHNYRLMATGAAAAIGEAAAITPDKALISDANGIPVAGSASAAELALLAGSTAWASFTPTGTWTTNTTYTGKYRIINGKLEGFVKVALSGAPDSAALLIDLPAGFAVNRNAVPDTAFFTVGQFFALDANGLTYIGTVALQGNVDTSMRLYVYLASATYTTVNGVTQILPFTFANGDYIAIQFAFPVVAV